MDKQTKRKTVSFEPMGPVASMIATAMRNKPRGAKTILMEDAIAEHFKEKYPKLYERYLILREEAA